MIALLSQIGTGNSVLLKMQLSLLTSQFACERCGNSDTELPAKFSEVRGRGREEEKKEGREMEGERREGK